MYGRGLVEAVTRLNCVDITERCYFSEEARLVTIQLSISRAQYSKAQPDVNHFSTISFSLNVTLFQFSSSHNNRGNSSGRSSWHFEPLTSRAVL